MVMAAECGAPHGGTAAREWAIFLTMVAASVVAVGVSSSAAWAQSTPPRLDADLGRNVLRLLTQLDYAGLERQAIGITPDLHRIIAWTPKEGVGLDERRLHIVLVGGLDGSPRSVSNVLASLDWFAHSEAAAGFRERYAVSAVPCALPEALVPRTGERPRSEGFRFPPAGQPYLFDAQAEAHYLWRWIGLAGVDLVVDVRGDQKISWRLPPGANAALAQVKAPHGEWGTVDGVGELTAALVKTPPTETGVIPALQVRGPSDEKDNLLRPLLEALDAARYAERSASRRELLARRQRDPRQVAEQLLVHFGRDLPQVQYIPAMALVARVRFHQLTGEVEKIDEVRQVVDRRLAAAGPKVGGGSDVAGHLIFAELARAAGEEDHKRYSPLVLNVAVAIGFDERATPRTIAPFHSEMSDAIFMSGPILAAAGRLSGDARYFTPCLNHLESMDRLTRRKDALYRHSPLDEAAWGRGNGFAVLGMALVLSDLPEEHPGHAPLVKRFRETCERLLLFHDGSGMWRQVIDEPGSYRELTATAMISFALMRGVRRGWLPADEFRPAIERAWEGLLLRTPANGRLIDVCTGTGKQRSLRDYLQRPALHGHDGRGGAMALLAAVERSEWLAESKDQ